MDAITFFSALPLMLIAVGTIVSLRTLWKLLTGGPRAETLPGAPYIYDRVYFGLGLVAYVSMTGFVVCLSSGFSGNQMMSSETWPIALCLWAVGAVASGLLILLRDEMMTTGARYQARNTVIPWRLYYEYRADSLENGWPWMRKGVATIILIVALGILVVNLPNLPSALKTSRLIQPSLPTLSMP